MKKTKDTLIRYALTPLSWAYDAVTNVRNRLFDAGILKAREFDVPVVCVGNITVGGTGKTPHVEYIVRNLASDYNIAVLSRGYKRKTKGFLLANPKSTPDAIGDEPYQIYQKYGHRVRVAVCEKRVKGIERLLELHPEINLIVLDDAYQHRYVKPKVSVLLMDYSRPIYRDNVLPLGRLRENRHAADRADFVVCTKCPDDLQPIQCRVVKNDLQLLAFQKLFFSKYEYSSLRPVFPEENPYTVSLENFTKRDTVLLLTGIAHPRYFVRYFRQFAFKVKVAHFSDHHDFSRTDLLDIAKMVKQMKGERKIIVTTEKDAVRLSNNPYFPEELKPFIFYLPLEVRMLRGMDEEEDFIDALREAIDRKDASITS